MAHCKSCSAPLPANINRCTFCNVRNDVDLNDKHSFSIVDNQQDRTCPHCEVSMQTIQLQLDSPFEIERCDTCYGLFFDPGEIETFLESAVSNVFGVNLSLIENINIDRYQKNTKVKYIKCPVCEIFMNRVNFGHKSGVVIDQCRDHGIWLDNGEITHLMEWKKAGGELLDVKKKSEVKKIKRTATNYQKSYNSLENYGQNTSMEDDLLKNIISLVFKIF